MRDKLDMSKLERLYIEYASKMKYAALEILKDKELAEDAVHNAFLKLIKNVYKLNEDDKAKTAAYLLISARNAARSLYNKQYGHGYNEDIDDITQISSPYDVENIVITKEMLNKVANILREMNPIYEDAFLLYYVYNHTIHEIAIMTDSKEDTVRKRIQRAREHIKAKIERGE